jgi:hypothetical protein
MEMNPYEHHLDCPPVRPAVDRRLAVRYAGGFDLCGGGRARGADQWRRRVQPDREPARCPVGEADALSFILAPAFKEWAMENKRTMSTVIFGIVLIGFSGELVALFFE